MIDECVIQEKVQVQGAQCIIYEGEDVIQYNI